MSPIDVRQAALDALAHGLSVLPPKEDGSKAPLAEDGQWKQYQRERATLDVIHSWYGTKGEPKRSGVGLVCGPVSGNAECFDFDRLGVAYEPFCTAARALGLGELIDRLNVGFLERSPSGGKHWLYRCAIIAGSTKLAQYESDEINPETGRPIIKPIIETKGTGGYIIVAPSNGRVHPTGGAYELLTGGFATIPTITPEERAALWDLARTFDELPKVARPTGEPAATKTAETWDDTISPVDDYNARASWPDILVGWSRVYTQGETEYWRRPGKDRGHSATVNHLGLGLFTCFTSSSAFEPGKTYSRYGAYAVLKHAGDFSAAALALIQAGYGTFKTWVQKDGQWVLETRQNPCPKGVRIAKPGERPPGAETEAAEEGFAGFVASPPQVCPISVVLRPVPKLDPRLIPKPFRAWLEDIAQRACCPLDLPAISATVAVATVVGRKVAIRPKRKDDWTVVPNLWGMGVLPPGWLKTHCLEEPKKPLARLEMEAKERHAEAMDEFAISEAVAAAKAEAAKASLKDAAKRKKGVEPASETELRELASQVLVKTDQVPPTMRRYIVNDTTVEKLGELLKENPNGLLLYRDELMGFLKNLEKQGHESDRAFYLEGWDGTAGFTYDRIGRGTLPIESNTISILGGIQPGKLAAYIREYGSGDDDDGFIPRFQLAVYPDTDQPFVNVDEWPNTEAKNRAYAVFKVLADLDPAAVGAVRDAPPSTPDIPYLRFADDAQPFFDTWRTELEGLVRSGREPSNLTSHLAKYRSLMPSLALLFHLIEVTGGKEPGPVSLESARRAAAWCAYLEDHARRIYQAAFDGDPEPAQRLAERIVASLPTPFTVRKVVQKGWKGLSDTESVERAVAILEEHGWVYCREVSPGPKGGRPSVEIHVNPRLLEGGAE
jgi:hypothetical protein